MKTNMRCEVYIRNDKCAKKASYTVRHKDHSEDKSFGVCSECIPAYKHKLHALAEGSFIVRSKKDKEMM